MFLISTVQWQIVNSCGFHLYFIKRGLLLFIFLRKITATAVYFIGCWYLFFVSILLISALTFIVPWMQRVGEGGVETVTSVSTALSRAGILVPKSPAAVAAVQTTIVHLVLGGPAYCSCVHKMHGFSTQEPLVGIAAPVCFLGEVSPGSGGSFTGIVCCGGRLHCEHT